MKNDFYSINNKKLIIKEIFGRRKTLKYLILKWEYQAICNYGNCIEGENKAHNDIMFFIKKGFLKEESGRILKLIG